jgi:hypothetical protein
MPPYTITMLGVWRVAIERDLEDVVRSGVVKPDSHCLDLVRLCFNAKASIVTGSGLNESPTCIEDPGQTATQLQNTTF